jgi:DNA repair protein RadC
MAIYLEMKLKELSKDSLPREKALKKGITSLSDQELLAIILGSGTKGKNVLELASEIVSIYRDFPTLATTQIDSFYSIR